MRDGDDAVRENVVDSFLTRECVTALFRHCYAGGGNVEEM